MRDRDDDEAAGGSATVSCWFCDHRLTARQVLRDGILRSRAEEAGGPYRILQCPACGRENLCERTRRGMWFSSPSSKVSFLDYLFSQYLAGEGAEAATLLAAMTWYRENEERRRYFFERDGDRRYSGRSFLSWLWPAPPGPAGRAGAGRPGRGEAAARAAAGGRRRPEGGEGRSRRASGAGRGPLPGATRIVSPFEVLGLAPTATEREIREAFHRLAIHYHPDKVRHLGEEFERVAHEKFLRLKEAYETLIKLRQGDRGRGGRRGP